MKLYRVYKCDYDYECTIGIFQSKYKALEIVEENKFDNHYHYAMEELTLDEVVE